jgi:hypothetical protein
MFNSLSPFAVRIIAAVLIVGAFGSVLDGAFWAGQRLGVQEERTRQLAASLAAEISLSKRQKSALDAASKQNQKLVEDLWREISTFSSGLAGIRTEVRNLPRIEELNCAPGPGRVDVVNRTLSN